MKPFHAATILTLTGLIHGGFCDEEGIPFAM